MGRGGSRDPAIWSRLLPHLAPDLLFAQESRDPAHSWLAALPATAATPGTPSGHQGRQSWLWEAVPAGRWGSGLWVSAGYVRPLEVPEAFTGRVVAAVVEC